MGVQRAIVAPLKWYDRAWFVASLVLTGLSLATALDHLLGWPSSLSPILVAYSALLSSISMALLGRGSQLLWHFEHLFVLMGGVFCSLNYYTLQTEGQTVFRRLRDMSRLQGGGGALHSLLFAFKRASALYLLGPFVCLYLCYVAVTSRAAYHEVFDFTFQPAKILFYYLSLFSAVTLILWLTSLPQM